MTLVTTEICTVPGCNMPLEAGNEKWCAEHQAVWDKEHPPPPPPTTDERLDKLEEEVETLKEEVVTIKKEYQLRLRR